MKTDKTTNQIQSTASGHVHTRSFLGLIALLGIALGSSCTEPISPASEHKPTTNVENVVRHPVTGERILDKYPDITKHPLYYREINPYMEQWLREFLERLSAEDTRKLLIHNEKKEKLRKSLKEGDYATIGNPVTGATEQVSNIKTATPASKQAKGKALRASSIPGNRHWVRSPAPGHEDKLIRLPQSGKDGFLKCPYSGRIFYIDF